MNQLYPLKSRTLTILLAAASLGLSACDPLDPVQISVRAQRNFDLQTEDHGRLALRQGQMMNGVVDYKAASKKIVLDFGPNGVAVFRKAVVDKANGTIVSGFEKSGQIDSDGERLSLSVQRTTRCDPACSETTVRDAVESCSYVERESYTVCENTPRGTKCWTEYRDVTRRGRQRVEITATEYFYQLRGEIRADRSGLVGSGGGNYSEVEERRRALSSCR